MDLQTTTNKEYHPNGQLAYIETIAIVPLEYRHLYQNTRILDGVETIRTGKNAKYFDNGQLAWVLNYDEFGNVIKENNRSYRKDGTPVIY